MRKNLNRKLEISLPSRQSAFLWGPRKTGKSTFLKKNFSNSIYIDLLDTDMFLNLLKRPALLRERLLAANPVMRRRPVVIDEVQKVPALMDEIHWLIENKGFRFILCGSSARKLRRNKANLLGGRAWRYEMFPLVSVELEKFDLLRILTHGLVPDHYFSEDPQKSLNGYIQDYLKEEIISEGLTRNVPAFSRFLDAVGYSHGDLISYANIARDCGVDAKTVKEYYQILIDTLLGRMVEPFRRRKSRQVITQAAKFYFFDVGVAGGFVHRNLIETRGDVFGKAFEHFIYMEILAHSFYSGLNHDIHYWRTRSGQEVDFILGNGEVAVEVKGSGRVDNKELHALTAFYSEHAPRRALLVCNELHERRVGPVNILPWRSFLSMLWSGDIIS